MQFKIISFFIFLTTVSNSALSFSPNIEDGYYHLDSGQYAQAFKHFLPFAKQGDEKIQYLIGRMYDNGRGLKENKKAAVAWYRKSAEKDYAPAQTFLGSAYYFAKGVPKDYKIAVFWLQKAAAQGDDNAQWLLSKALEHGYGIQKNIPKAIILREKAAEQGSDIKQSRLAIDYTYGSTSGWPIDLKRAVYWNRKQAEKGFSDAQYDLGRVYSEGLGVLRNYDEAITWYEKAAKQGLGVSQMALGELYCEGKNVKKDLRKCAIWVKKAFDNEEKNASELWEKYELWNHLN